ncbi:MULTISPECIES: ABC-F family ATP-binding cassette domain-containing protein [unclassified Prochlorococcus]|uniref:ABC-F family ATP-binding cassette domain-containing protein n=1 Tax=unclassified Prochlorococcus TaxID=2627481 RepID=UPI0005339601|nr:MULTISPECIES: ABC-F family ATP-binding cassette domain-containing protein [unclassified Prochlorococcus]KGG16851.1 ATP-binding protein of ABC transporter [Prochlorococcus sp. MIT 0602]KGG18175.1 ATP-binding protein of ABC transporter [Prochlorococcus sp. MIT 0603]
MIRLERVSKIYPTAEVLKEITWEIRAGQRIGLVGINGAGKSTQLKLIAGLEDPTTGEVIYEGEPRIAYLQQEFDVDLNRTVREELFQAFADAADVLTQKKSIEHDMASHRAKLDNTYLNNLIKELGSLQIRFESLHGYELEAKIEKLLPKIGFSSNEGDSLVGDFSGGWQMRIALGKILLQDPDLLLLDEPTNHLDLDTIEWLENYLLNQNSAMVIISHDRSFLDKICTHIVSTERGISRTYIGNYSYYLEQKKLELDSAKSAFERQQKELSSQQQYIDRFRASATRSTQAKSREKLLTKIERVDLPISELNKPIFNFPDAPRSGKNVVKVDDLSHTYNEKIIFLGAQLEVEPGNHIAILGPNGSGKSTLLRLIMGIEKPVDGIIEIGSHNVFPSYFEQNQSEALNLQKTVLDTFFDSAPDWTQTKARSLLGSFGFSNDDVFKTVSDLSGGEKARLALALIIIKPCNLLLLDEPTNHLDIPAKEMLETAIKDFQGALLVVSHDRYFISKVANTIVEIKDGQLYLYRGNYEYYKEKKIQEKEKTEKLIAEAEREAKRIEKRKLKSKNKSKKKK